MDIALSDFILIIAAVIVGLVIFGFTTAYIAPQYAFTYAEQSAKTISQTTFVSISPPETTNSGCCNYLVDVYSPGFSGNFTVVAFYIPSSELQSIAIVTPSSSSSFPVYINSTLASKVTLSNVYDINGHLLVSSISGYTIPANYPIQIIAPPKPGCSLVIWIIYSNGGYNFRVLYAYG
ncbi:conserved hypothetical protein [Acidianus hospitalis W1]|uniref:Uncharacterized protein n=1 Tax=Acidianus hospitalis (strain W1) TaxID=933801 RepID=F4B7B1_ACIHW|nr:hypothetical protein [Acidianus hospitalis]AEE94731.1 conserved hypothetical protein [Acidianus hospitalis W1]